MARVTQAVKNLIAGVSQQPARLRHMEQLEEQINAFSTTADGLQKRPPTLLQDVLDTSTTPWWHDKVKVHFINRDENEKYIVFLDGTQVRVFDINNHQWKPVHYNKLNNPKFGDNDAKEYISNSNPKDNFELVTVADYTFLVNKTKIVQMNTDRYTQPYSKGAIVQVKQGQYGRRYVIDIGGKNVAVYNTPDGSKPEHSTQIDTQYIADKLREAIQTNGSIGNGVMLIVKKNCFLIKGVNQDSINIEMYKGALKIAGTKPSNVTQYNSYGINFVYEDTKSGMLQGMSLKAFDNGFYAKISGITNIRVHKGAGWVAVGFDQSYRETIVTGKTSFGGSRTQEVTKTTDYLMDNNFPSNQFNNEEKQVKGGIRVGWLPSGIHIEDLKGQSISVHDGFNNQALTVFTTSVQHFSDLPKTAPDGYLVEVKGETSTDDDYYVRYDSQKKLWEETTAGGILSHQYYETMPYAITRNSDGSFTVSAITWAGRSTGDEDSNPEQSFVGEKITDIFFYRNRLGLIAGESICLSKSGDYFNFWVDSATGIIDTDPIDLTVSSNRICNLHSAVPFGQDLFLFSDNDQFVLRADGALSPKNASLTQATQFNSNKRIHPIGVDKNIYYMTERSAHASVREYYTIADGSGDKDSTDITSHVPNYILNKVSQLIACSNENLIAVLSDGANDTLYIYKYLYAGEQKVQSSWSKWVFNGRIVGAEFIGSSLYVVLHRGNKLLLEKMDISFNTTDFDNEPYRYLMDSKQVIPWSTVKTHIVSKNTPETTAKVNVSDWLEVNDNYTCYICYPDGRVFKGNNIVEVSLVDIPEQVFVGIAYDMYIEFSPFYIKQVDQQGTTPRENYKLILQYFSLATSDSGEFIVNVNTTGKPERNYKFTGRIVGSDHNRLDRRPMETQEFKIPVHGNNLETRISVHNDSPLPSTFIGYAWQGNVTMRFKQL